VNPNCTNLGGNWNASESGTETLTVVAPIENDSAMTPVGGTGSVTITQTGCAIQYDPIGESGLIGTNLTPSQVASVRRTGTVSGNNVSVTGIAALIDTVAAAQNGITIAKVSTNLLTGTGQVVGNLLTINETGNFVASGTYSISGQSGSFTLTIATSSVATLNWASGVRPADRTLPMEIRVATNPANPLPNRQDMQAPLRAALKKALIFGDK
jgi:hypothetical protein